MSEDNFDYTDLRHMWVNESLKERPQRESWAHSAMAQISKLVHQMKVDGWKEIIYCPKDGTVFLAWEPECALPFACVYHGKWPSGSWMGMYDGDGWPARPSLYKLMPEDSV